MKFSSVNIHRYLPLLLVTVLVTLAGTPLAQADGATALQARHTALRAALASNQFKRALHLESSQPSGGLKGDVYAEIAQPYAVVGPALQGMEHWCDILILHLNVKSCQASSPKSGDTLSLHIGRKHDQPLDDAYPVEFRYKLAVNRPDYLQVVLNADKGPLGTSDYRIMLEVVALDAKRSFLHLSYSYSYGLAARAAMKGYLATIGSGKVGFSIVRHKAGKPVHISGVLGAVERNTMRYYLAIEAYLGALSTPAAQQQEKRLNDWHSAVERYPLQLHELERKAYLDMKHKEIKRQQAGGP